MFLIHWLRVVACLANVCDSAHVDIQEKIRRVVEQGHIDAEDFNGVCIEPHSISYLEVY